MRRALVAAVVAVVFLSALVIRVHGVADRFWLLHDQIRDWGIALGPFWSLPLVGSPTHVGGYTIGPAFYWILWIIRVIVGPWFQNLPHAGGIGQAILQSAVDALLVVAIWKRTGSPWPALAIIAVLVTAPFDLSLAAVVWNPVMGAILAKAAIALVLLDWHKGSEVRLALTAAIAWCAVHVYTGAVFVALSVFAALVFVPGWRGASRRLAIVAVVVGLLQVPYVVHQLEGRSDVAGMEAVSGSVTRIFTGRDQTRFGESTAFYASAVASIEAAPWIVPAAGWLLLACAGLFAFRFRGDQTLLALTLLPQLLTIVGYAFWVSAYDTYYYLSLMPAAMMTIVLGIIFSLPKRTRPPVAIAMLACALAIAPTRVAAAHIFDMPMYRALVKASRTLVGSGQPVRAIETSVSLPPTSDPAFIYRILGGRLDPTSTLVPVIQPDGGVEFRRAVEK